ncbi:outer membrane beta-barrel protein [Rheinheimera soli]|uniref:Long-subunit fatty acid transport protein n=1 Tax=Rheinheimera soli TaxID=443616 RepID=A0ABU1W430_9GAMM|nr:outer membrane beta-barrel protein [Rheinheimera soli]MDR7122727.1 long-subunit fatty acid transport protein [Rheinheimera soli]
MNYFVATCFAAILSASAYAEVNQFSYFSLSAAQQTYDDVHFATPEQQQQLDPAKFNQNDSGTGFRVAAGFQFNEYLALELGFISPAKADFSIYTEATDTEKRETLVGGDLKAFGADSRLILSYPFNNDWYARAQLGLVWQRATLQQLSTIVPYTMQETKTTDTSTLLAAGVGYSINRNLSLAADVEHGELMDFDQQSYRLSLLFRFN